MRNNELVFSICIHILFLNFTILTKSTRLRKSCPKLSISRYFLVTPVRILNKRKSCILINPSIAYLKSHANGGHCNVPTRACIRKSQTLLRGITSNYRAADAIKMQFSKRTPRQFRNTNTSV